MKGFSQIDCLQGDTWYGKRCITSEAVKVDAMKDDIGQKKHFKPSLQEHAPPFFAWVRSNDYTYDLPYETEAQRMAEWTNMCRSPGSKIYPMDHQMDAETRMDCDTIHSTSICPVLKKNCATSTREDDSYDRKRVDIPPTRNDHSYDRQRIEIPPTVSQANVSYPPLYGAPVGQPEHMDEYYKRYWQWLNWYSSWQNFYMQEREQRRKTKHRKPKTKEKKKKKKKKKKATPEELSIPSFPSPPPPPRRQEAMKHAPAAAWWCDLKDPNESDTFKQDTSHLTSLNAFSESDSSVLSRV